MVRQKFSLKTFQSTCDCGTKYFQHHEENHKANVDAVLEE